MASLVLNRLGEGKRFSPPTWSEYEATTWRTDTLSATSRLDTTSQVHGGACVIWRLAYNCIHLLVHCQILGPTMMVIV